MAECGRGKSNRIFKKWALNNKMKLYIARRDLVLEPNRVERVEGVMLIDPDYADNRNLYGQLVKTIRYGREDREESLGVFNEKVMNMVKIWPTTTSEKNMNVTSLQSLVRKLGPNAAPFYMEVTYNWQPSLILWQKQPYDGPPVGITYDVRVFLAEGPDDIVSKRNIVRMGIRITHSAAGIDTAPLLTPTPSSESFRVKPLYKRLKNMLTSGARRRPKKLVEDPGTDTEDQSVQTEFEMIEENIDYEEQENNKKDKDIEQTEESKEMGGAKSENEEEDKKEKEEISTFEEIQVNEEVTAAAVVRRPAPRLLVEKSFLSRGKLQLESWLDKSSYHHGEKILVFLRIRNNSTKTVRCIQAKVIQHVDNRMFGNGIFKNVVAIADDDSDSVPPGKTLYNFYSMLPRRVPTENWLAVEDSVNNPEGCLASTVICPPEVAKEKNVYSIYVAYYVKVHLHMNRFGGELSVKLPFSLSHAPRYDGAVYNVPEESANRPYMKEGLHGAEDEEKNNEDVEKDYN